MVDEQRSRDDEATGGVPGRTGGLVALGISQSVDNSEGGVSKVFFPQITAAFGVGDRELGLLTALGMIARMICGPLWSWLADRFGRKNVLLIITGLWGLWTAAAALATSWTMLLIIYGISLAGTVASEPISNGLLSSLYARSERGKAFGLVRAVSTTLGFALTPLVGQFGANPEGWRWAFVTLGVLSVLSGLLIWLFVHEPDAAASDLDAADGRISWRDVGAVLKIPTVRLMVPMLLFVTSLVLFGFMGKMWASDFGFGVTNSAYLFTDFQIGATLSALGGGLLGDWFARRFGPKGRVLLFQLYALAFAATTYLMTQVPHWFDSDVSRLTDAMVEAGQASTNDPSIGYYAIVFVTGLVFSVGFSGSVLPMVSTVSPPQLSATTFALLFSLVQGFITAVWSVLAGHLADLWDNLPLALLYFVPLGYLVNAAYWFVFYRTYPRDVERQVQAARR